jgi:hypothetical protein
MNKLQNRLLPAIAAVMLQRRETTRPANRGDRAASTPSRSHQRKAPAHRPGLCR